MGNVNQKNLGRQAQLIMIKTKSCALTQIKIFQELLDNHEYEILEPISGLSGGVLSKGSTCGVVFSGALSIAMLLDSKLNNWESQDEIALHQLIREYIKWFEGNYKSTLCRERIKLDLWTKKGVAKLLLPQKLIKCLSHTKGSIIYLSSLVEKFQFEEREETIRTSQNLHCARTVLEKVRKATSIGNNYLEKISIALDGGVGLQGGACGAITGAIMALNLQNFHSKIDKSSINIKNNKAKYLSFPLTDKKKKKNNSNKNKNLAGYQAKRLIEQFLEKTNSLECKDIINKRFSNWKEFQNYRTSSNICEGLIDFTSEEVIKIIKYEYE